MDNDRLIGILNNLIETCRDGREGFEEAAKNVASKDLKGFFSEVSQQRANYVGELELQVRALGGSPEASGSVAGAARRVWINIKGTVTGLDEKTILSEAERAEDLAVEAYEKALSEGLPVNIRLLIDTQYRDIIAVHDHVKRLRDKLAAGVGRG